MGKWQLFLVIFLGGLIIPALGFLNPKYIVYLWTIVASIHLIIPEITIISNIKQTLYGAMCLCSLPVITIVFILNFKKMKKGFTFLWPIAGLILVAIFSSIKNHFLALETFRTAGGLYVFLLVNLFAYGFIKKNEDLKMLLIISIITSIVISLHAIIDFLYFRQMTRHFGSTVRASSFFIQNANALAHYVVFFLSLCLALFIKEKRIIYCLLVLFYLIVIVLTFSIAGFAATAAAILLIFIYTGLYKNPVYLFNLFLLGALLVVIFFQLGLIHHPAFYHVATFGTFNFRSKIWPVAIKLIIQQPFLGYTPKMYPLILGKAAHLSSSIAAHNFLLSFLLSYGIIGTGIIVRLFYNLYKKLKKSITLSSDSFVSSCSMGCICYMFSSFIYGIAHSFDINSVYILPFWFISTSITGIVDKENY